MEERRATGLALKKAEIERMERFKNPEADPSWLRNYSLALRDAIRKANARFKPELLALNNDDWQHLIKSAMLAGQYTVDPNAESAYERAEREGIEKVEKERLEQIRQMDELKRQALESAPSVREEMIKELPQAMRDEVSATVASVPEGDDEVWLNNTEKGTWTGKSSLSGKVLGTDFTSEKEARKRVKDYNYRYNRRQSIRVGSE